MDTVSPAARRRTTLWQMLDEARGALHRAASAAEIKDDPLAQQLQALAITLGALGEIYDASANTQMEINEKLRAQADEVANEAINRVHASGVGIIEQLAPRLAVMVEQTIRKSQRERLVRAILGGTAALLVAIGFAAAMAYGGGYAAGRAQGAQDGRTIAAAMAAGPDAASAWASLMAENDPVQALATCKKSVSTDTAGRRYCAMPVWLDPPTKTLPGP
jgi:hypothetical protein